MTASVGSPALTMMITRRGFSSAARNSGIVSLRMKLPSEPCSASSASVLAMERLCSATVYPWWAKLRARLDPITARPVTPIWAVPVVSECADVLMRTAFRCFVVMGLSAGYHYAVNSRCNSVSQGTASASVGTTRTAVAAR